MSYAFGVFAAIYGHHVSNGAPKGEELRCTYGGQASTGRNSSRGHIPARYRLRPPREAPPQPVGHSYANENLHLFYGVDAVSANPDWLGEIFEWLSSSCETSVTARDVVGRVPYNETIFGRYSISPLRAHALLIMSWFENFLRNPKGSEQFPVAPSPVPNAGHLVVCSHDLDFYPVRTWQTFIRIIKNIGVAILVTHSRTFFRNNCRLLLDLAQGKDVGDFLPRLLAISNDQRFSSTFFVLVRRGHRRDANYSLEQIFSKLQAILNTRSQIALHGSYRSIVEDASLDSEATMLQVWLGTRPCGSRQHWLRFDQPGKLFSNMEKAGLQYDASTGFVQQIGFRNGAPFAFPPYNFEREEPYPFLLIPLAIMDKALEHRSTSFQEANEAAGAVFEESSRLGWGGFSILWHDPLEPLSVSDDINRVFWQQLEMRAQRNELWMSAEEFLEVTRKRYENAGLLPTHNPAHIAA